MATYAVDAINAVGLLFCAGWRLSRYARPRAVKAESSEDIDRKV